MDKLIITKHLPCHPERSEGSHDQNCILTLHIRDNHPYRISLDPEQEDAPGVGDVYRTRVQSIHPGLKNAFLDLGEGYRAYMNITEYMEPMKPGQEISVMISQEGIGDKLPTATTDLSFPGEWLVLSSDPGFLGFSRRASFDGPEREAIHETLSPYFKDCGFILRTSAEQVPLEQIAEEGARMAEAYRALMQKAAHSPAPMRIHRGQPLYREWIQSLPKEKTEVVTDDAAIYHVIKDYYASRQISPEHLHFYQDENLSLSSLYQMEKALKEARDKRVWLGSGAYLVIEHTEAMTVIDVNSGKNESGARGTTQRINQEAAREVARQLILRNLSGMILVDFINMKAAEDNHALLEQLRWLVREDPVLTQVVDMTGLGLVEITRRRLRKPLFP